MFKIPGKARNILRAIHRDIGYLGVGLTVVYALSGIAVNHIQDWEPNQTTLSGSAPFSNAGATSDQAMAQQAAAQVLGSQALVDAASVYREGELLEFQSQQTRFFVDLDLAQISWERDEDRFFFKAANWLHLNRGKKAWTYIADSYAVALLFLALSGLWMIPGKRGFWGRGIILVLLGASIPVAYVHFSAQGSQDQAAP